MVAHQQPLVRLDRCNTCHGAAMTGWCRWAPEEWKLDFNFPEDAIICNYIWHVMDDTHVPRERDHYTRVKEAAPKLFCIRCHFLHLKAHLPSLSSLDPKSASEKLGKPTGAITPWTVPRGSYPTPFFSVPHSMVRICYIEK